MVHLFHLDIGNPVQQTLRKNVVLCVQEGGHLGGVLALRATFTLGSAEETPGPPLPKAPIFRSPELP